MNICETILRLSLFLIHSFDSKRFSLGFIFGVSLGCTYGCVKMSKYSVGHRTWKKKLCASKQPSDVRVHKHKIWIFDSYFGFRFGFDFDFGFAHWYSGPLVFHSMWMYVVCWLCPSVARSNRTDVSCVCACVALDYGDRPKANNVHNHCGIIIYAA